MNIVRSIQNFFSQKVIAGAFLGFLFILLAAPIQLQFSQIKNAETQQAGITARVVPLQAYAQTESRGIPVCNGMAAFFEDPAKCAIFGVLWVVFQVSAWFVKLSGWLLDIILSYTLSSITYNNQQGWITQGWALLRDFINIFFIALLLIIAGRMILNLDGDAWKKQLINIAVAALLINFSLFFTKVIIDGGNITARVFYRAMDLQPIDRIDALSPGAATRKSLDLPVEVRSVTAAIIDKSNAITFLGSIGQSDASMGSFTRDWAVVFFYVIVGTVMYIYMTYMFLNIAFYFFARTLGIWFFMIASPLAFLSAVKISWLKKFFEAPALKEFGWDSYFSNLAKMAFQPAVFCFMMYLTIISINLFVFTTGGNGQFIFSNSQTSNDFFLQIVYLMVPMIVVFGIIIMTKRVTDKFSTAMGEFLTSGVKSVVGAVGGLALGGAGLAARSTIGARLAGSKALSKGSEMSAKALEGLAKGENYLGNQMKLRYGKALTGIQKYGREGSWDVRNLEEKLRSNLNSFAGKTGLAKAGVKFDTGINFNTAKVGLPGVGDIDFSKVSVGKGYSLLGEKGIFEEGREGGFTKHGDILSAYRQKFFEEATKERNGELLRAIEGDEKKRDGFKSDREEAEAQIANIGFNGDVSEARKFLRRVDKLQKEMDGIDGGYTGAEYQLDQIERDVLNYKSDPEKYPLSSVITNLEVNYTRGIDELEEEKTAISALPEGAEKERRLAKNKKAREKFETAFSKKKGELIGEYEQRVRESKKAISPSDTPEEQAKKQAFNAEIASLEALRSSFVNDDHITQKSHILKEGYKLEDVTNVKRDIFKKQARKIDQRIEKKKRYEAELGSKKAELERIEQDVDLQDNNITAHAKTLEDEKAKLENLQNKLDDLNEYMQVESRLKQVNLELMKPEKKNDIALMNEARNLDARLEESKRKTAGIADIGAEVARVTNEIGSLTGEKGSVTKLENEHKKMTTDLDNNKQRLAGIRDSLGKIEQRKAVIKKKMDEEYIKNVSANKEEIEEIYEERHEFAKNEDEINDTIALKKREINAENKVLFEAVESNVKKEREKLNRLRTVLGAGIPAVGAGAAAAGVWGAGLAGAATGLGAYAAYDELQKKGYYKKMNSANIKNTTNTRIVGNNSNNKGGDSAKKGDKGGSNQKNGGKPSGKK